MSSSAEMTIDAFTIVQNILRFQTDMLASRITFFSNLNNFVHPSEYPCTYITKSLNRTLLQYMIGYKMRNSKIRTVASIRVSNRE